MARGGSPFWAAVLFLAGGWPDADRVVRRSGRRMRAGT